MRVTTQMLNSSAQKAGLPVNRTSLLNYINGNNSNISAANALSKMNNASDATKKSDYEKLEKSADGAAASTDKLISAGSENATAADLQSFVDKYNDMLKSLGKSADTLNLFYAQTAKDTVNEYKKELAELGVTVAKDGTLSFDKAKFEKFRAEQAAKAPAAESAATDAATQDSTVQESGTAQESGAAQAGADTSEAAKAAEESKTTETTASGLDAKLNALFAREGGFFSKLSFLASRVSDYADANAGSYSDYYNAAGSRANAYSNGRYNFWS